MRAAGSASPGALRVNRAQAGTGGRAMPEATAKTSVLLARLRERPAGAGVSLATIAAATRGRANGLLLLILALPETIPMVGFSLLLAIPIAIVGYYQLLTRGERALPRWVLRREIRHEILVAALDRTLPWLRRIERLLRPRWPWLARADRLLGALTLVMAILLGLPVPGVNILAALAVACVGLGLLERDGVLVAAALVLATAALATFGMLLLLGATIVNDVAAGV